MRSGNKRPNRLFAHTGNAHKGAWKRDEEQKQGKFQLTKIHTRVVLDGIKLLHHALRSGFVQGTQTLARPVRLDSKSPMRESQPPHAQLRVRVRRQGLVLTSRMYSLDGMWPSPGAKAARRYFFAILQNTEAST